jgi:hypothetical protein
MKSAEHYKSLQADTDSVQQWNHFKLILIRYNSEITSSW